jgi:hypothetical protein
MTKSKVAHSKNNGRGPRPRRRSLNVLEHEMDFGIHDWMEMVEKQDNLMHVFVRTDTVSGYFLRSC